MHTRRLVVLLSFAALTRPALAQPGAAARTGAPLHVAPAEARQFDFLVGEWHVVVRPKAVGLAQRMHGVPRILGSWRASRALDGWGIEDDLQLMDGSGNPTTLSHTVRVYDATASRWSLTSLDVYRGRFSAATGEWNGGEMVLTSRQKDQEGRAFLMRTRYYDISPAGFKVQQDHSYDDGRTWEEAVLRIEASR